MTDVIISSDIPRHVSYVATAGQTTFAIPFAYFNETDVRVNVYRAGVIVAAYVGGDGSAGCTPVKDANVVGGVAGTVFIPARLAGDEVFVYAATDPDRLTQFTDMGEFKASRVNAEFNRRVAVDIELNERITRVDQSVAAVDDAIRADMVAADAALQANIDAANTARANGDTTLQTNIDAANTARAEGDNAVRAEFAAADTGLQNQITAEVASRIASDNTVRSEFAAADTAIRNDMTAADAALQADINSAIRAPLGEVLNRLPNAAARAGKALAFDGAGQPILTEFIEGVGTVHASWTEPLTNGISPNVASLLAAPDYADIRTQLSLGSAALQNIGTSGATVPLLSTGNTWAAEQVFGANAYSSGVAPNYRFYESDAATDEKWWRLLSADGDFFIGGHNDAFTVGFSAIAIHRAGAAASSIDLTANTINVQGNAVVTGTAQVSSSFTTMGMATFNAGRANAPPATSGSTPSTGTCARLAVSDTTLCLDMGVANSGPNAPYLWLQGTIYTDFSQKFDIRLNPNGGNVYAGGIFTAAGPVGLQVSNPVGGVRHTAVGDFYLDVSSGGTMGNFYIRNGSGFTECLTILFNGNTLLGVAKSFNMRTGSVTFSMTPTAGGTDGVVFSASAACYWQFNSGGIIMSAAAGGHKGTGTINAQAVYDDNVLLTDLVLDLAVGGAWDRKAYARHPLNAELQTWWLDPKAYAAFWREARHLPEQIAWLDEAARPAIGAQVTRLVASAEIHAVHLANHEDRISQLEMKMAA